MRIKFRILSLLLILALIPGMCPTVSAEDIRPFDRFAYLETDFYIYPTGDCIGATLLPGETKVLSFTSSRPIGFGTDFYCVQIYRGSVDQLTDALSHSKEPEPIEFFYKSAPEFQETCYLYVNWTADSRYPVGDYCAVCFLMDGLTGEIYNDNQLFWLDLHVVSARQPDTELTIWVMADDGWYELPEYGILPVSFADSNFRLALIPGPTPSINRPNYKIYCSEYDVLQFGMNKGYLEMWVRNEGMALFTVVAGNATRNFWVKCGSFNEATDVKIYRDTDTLCVGAQTKCKVRSKHSQYARLIGAEWSSSDPSVASVNNLGVVTALKPGTVQITAAACAYTETVEFTVNYHQLPEGTPVIARTATQPKQAMGHCSVCGQDNAVNIYEEAIFTDTVASSWYAVHVDLVYDLGLMNGTGEHSFSPESPLTRAMAATVLYRIAGKPEVEGESPFPDVPENQWYTDAVIWAQANGIVTGYQDGTFGPNRNITREQFAAILYRYTKALDPEITAAADLNSFPDAGAVQSYALEAMRWAVGEGLINGVAVGGQSFLRPENNTTRAQFATIISRYLTPREMPSLASEDAGT